MNRFAALLDRLAYESGRNAKLRLLEDYFRTTPDPERGYALAAITGALSFRHAKPGLIRELIAERTDPVLFAMSYDYVGDLSETVALMWPAPARHGGAAVPSLSEVVTTLATLGKAELPAKLATWLDALDETGRWALLKLLTGALRIGVSARLAKTAVAALGSQEPDEVELVWPSLTPPYADLFAWLEGRAARPASGDPAPFRPPMLSHAIEEADFSSLDPSDFVAEWKWDGIRVQAAAGRLADGRKIARLYSRTGEDISGAFPDLAEALDFDGALDGELLIMREGRVQSFNVLQQRLNRKTVSARLLADFPPICAPTTFWSTATATCAMSPSKRVARGSKPSSTRLASPRIDLSPQVAFSSWDALAAARADPAHAGAGDDAEAVEGVMIKQRASRYLPGRPKGPWWKWKRDPFVIDAVLMYAQRGHGKRSSFYSDYTFGVWTEGEAGDELVPVGKAYFGFTDAELAEIDRFVRRNTTSRFGPVREVTHSRDEGLVFEVAFEGLQRSTRHKSGVAMRFPRISRLRWDKPPRDADRLDTLVALLDRTTGNVADGASALILPAGHVVK